MRPASAITLPEREKLGAAGDFITAPEMTPLFATALATQVAAILAVTQRREIVELGGGSGRLAADLLAALAARDALPSRYAILEVSPDLARRQRATLARDAPAHLDRVAWIAALPETIDGALIANEVLDAVPVELVARRGGRWLERGVTWDDARSAFAWAERPAGARLAAMAAARFPHDGDYASEINPAAEALVEDVGRRLVGGAALFIDYGFPAAEYYHPQRNEGTLMCHYRHRAHGDPFAWPGLTDITAHVDFTAMAEAGERAGLHVAGLRRAGAVPDRLRHTRCARGDRRAGVARLRPGGGGRAEARSRRPRWGSCSRSWRWRDRKRSRGPDSMSPIAVTGCSVSRSQTNI